VHAGPDDLAVLGPQLGGDPAPDELDLSGATDLRATCLGGRFLDWFDRYVKDVATVSTGPEFSYFQDWVGCSGIATPAYASSDAFPVGQPLPLYLSGDKTIVTATRDVRNGSQSYANGPAGSPTSYSETSSQGGSNTDPISPSDAPGTFAEWPRRPSATRRSLPARRLSR